MARGGFYAFVENFQRGDLFHDEGGEVNQVTGFQESRQPSVCNLAGGKAMGCCLPQWQKVGVASFHFDADANCCS